MPRRSVAKRRGGGPELLSTNELRLGKPRACDTRRIPSRRKRRAGGLNLVVAAIVPWTTVYLERAVETLRAGGTAVPDELLQQLSPLAWEHIILTGEYRWGSDEARQPGQRRELRPAR